MTVISINEECHGFIGLAKDFESAKDFLIRHGWIDECLEICENNRWRYIDEVLGSDWKIKVMNMTMEEFEETFEDSFLLDTIEVYGT
jgi:uncharacterized Fe-S radical SAM superfamily protein PflX